MEKVVVQVFKLIEQTIRGKLYAESPVSGGKCEFKGNCRIGAFSYIGKGSAVSNSEIARYCSIAPNVTIGPVEHAWRIVSTHPFASGMAGPFAQSPEFQDIRSPFRNAPATGRTVIGNDVWIGANVVIRAGVTVGDGAVIGAGSTVVKDVPPYAVGGGVPARLIRFRFADEMIARLRAAQWWDYDLRALGKVDYSDVDAFLVLLEGMKARQEMPLLQPEVRVYDSSATATPAPA